MTGPDAALLDAIYEGAFDEHALERALDRMVTRLAVRSAVIVLADLQRPENSTVVATEVFRPGLRPYAEHYGAIDPAPGAFARALPAYKAASTDEILDREASRGEFFHDFYVPMGFAETLGGTILSDGGRWSLTGFHRGPDRPPFDADDIHYVEQALPHFARALQMRRSFGRLRGQAEGLQAAVDRLAAGVVLLDASGALVFANRAMREIARRGDGLALDRAGRPVPVGSEARGQLARLLDEAGRGAAGGIVSAPRSLGGAPYSLLVAPCPTPLAARSWDRAGAATVIVLVHDPASRTADPVRLLAEGLGLPAAAARLVAALATDADLQVHAEREGITIHTARFHLRTALARTGTRTQAELVRRAVAYLRDVGMRG
jgi:GAF domain-containing protein